MAHTNEVEFPELLYQTIKEEKKLENMLERYLAL